MLKSIVTAIAFQPPPPLNARGRRGRRGNWQTLHTRSGDVPIFECAPTRAVGARSRICVLYSHGNAEDLDEIAPYLQRLADGLDISVLGYDYPGYSAAPTASDADPAAKCSEQGCYDAADAAWAHARESFERVVLFGRSLGSGPATYLAAQRCAAGDTALVWALCCSRRSPHKAHRR